MSKSDDALEAIADVKAEVVSGLPVESAISEIAADYDLKPHVLSTWLLREFETIDALQAWANTRRELILKKSASFQGLKDVIGGMSETAVFSKSIPQFTPWWKWIREHSWEPEAMRREALDFAKIEIRRRQTDIIFQKNATN